MAKVVLNNVKRKFDKVTAIENISFEVPDGEFWVLVGPSGCGKSTILRTIAGLETITSGSLYIAIAWLMIYQLDPGMWQWCSKITPFILIKPLLKI